MCSTSFARPHNPPLFAFPKEISSPLRKAQAVRNLSLLLSYLEEGRNEIRPYTTSVPSCSTFLFSSSITQHLPCDLPNLGLPTRKVWKEEQGWGLAWENSRAPWLEKAKQALPSAQRGGGSLRTIPASAGWGLFFRAPEQQFPACVQSAPRSLSKLPQVQH